MRIGHLLGDGAAATVDPVRGAILVALRELERRGALD